MTPEPYPVNGACLGLRRSFLEAWAEQPPQAVAFYEIAPENWIGMGDLNTRRLRALAERHPFVYHGLSLSIGAPAPLDLHFVRQIKAFLDELGIRADTEHLSYCFDDGHLYDLLPIPFTEEAVRHLVHPQPSANTQFKPNIFNALNRAGSKGRQVCRGRSHPKTSHAAPGAV
ncbi:DUF692 family multinuclear iron-containing protein [Thiocapsa sp.]|uniref:multinuclear nonheme iron-dependent oxidase n=1 Tax=Thiocapsa sp. TaxID=2024551 RepID=UPI0035946370